MSVLKDNPSSARTGVDSKSVVRNLDVSQGHSAQKELYREERRHNHSAHSHSTKSPSRVERPGEFERPRQIGQPHETRHPHEMERRVIPLERPAESERVQREAAFVVRLAERGQTRDLERIERLTQRAPSERAEQIERVLKTGHNLELKEILERLETRRAEQQEGKAFESSSRAAKEVFEAMRGGVTGTGTDEQRVFKLLAGRSPEELRRLKEAYREHYGRDLERDLRAELKDNKRFLDAAGILLRGSKLESAAALIRMETSLPAPRSKAAARSVGRAFAAADGTSQAPLSGALWRAARGGLAEVT